MAVQVMKMEVMLLIEVMVVMVEVVEVQELMGWKGH